MSESKLTPRHVAIIMDGNGRWAKKRGLPRTAGHTRGAEVFRDIIRYCNELEVACVTFYAFSTENWALNPCVPPCAPPSAAGCVT